MPTTATGTFESSVVPSPSSPLALSPQQETVPSVCVAQVWEMTAATVTTSVVPVTSGSRQSERKGSGVQSGQRGGWSAAPSRNDATSTGPAS